MERTMHIGWRGVKGGFGVQRGQGGVKVGDRKDKEDRTIDKNDKTLHAETGH